MAWATSTATGVKVAILDTGIDLDHPDLGANVKGGINTINPRKKPDDDNGHGSRVAGIVAAVRGNEIGVIGVEPSASLYAVKVLGASGSGYASDIIEGLDWCIQNGIKVVNMSFGASSDNQSIHDAVIRAYNAGIIMVAAAGNSGPGSDTVSYPARYNEVIAVAATDSNDAVAPWSSRGPEVDIAAPGVNIYSTYKNAGYATMSGTSMAAPHVTGAIALKLQVNPLLSPDAMRSLVVGTAEPILGAPEEVGAGLIDAEALVNAQ
ncbi:MAG: S8 family peptidase [Actinomycetota bacterium]